MSTQISSYALPLPAVSHRSSKAVRQKKRKRTWIDEEFSDSDDPSRDVEYYAVVTPEERVQRRLAGQPLNENPPSFPFPHAPLSDKAHGDKDVRSLLQASNNVPLRIQHLSNMTALLHRCLANHDYARASRALALILRTEVHGRTIDFRNAGLWGIGAELLFKLSSHPGSHAITRDGFEKVRSFYDRMSLQHPWHRSWPDVVNVQDFKIALFGLWVYVVDQESRRLQDTGNGETDDEQQLTAKEWELAEAENISRELDSLMSTLPFMDDLELIRIRAMVALWTADLIESIGDLRREEVDSELELERAWMGETKQDARSQTAVPNSNAEAARAMARKMFAKLGINDKNKDIGEDEIFG